MLNLLLLTSAANFLVGAVLGIDEEPAYINADFFCEGLTKGGECDQGWDYECMQESSESNPGIMWCFCRCGTMLEFTPSESCLPPGPTCVHRCDDYYYDDGQPICSCRPDCGSSGNCCPDFDDICTAVGGSLFDEELRIADRVRVALNGSSGIEDFTVTTGLLLAVQHVTYSTRVVELDPLGSSPVARVLYDDIRGSPRGIASTREGDLYIATENALTMYSAGGRQYIVADGMYERCSVDVDGAIVYAPRVTAVGQPVLVDVVIDGAINRTIQTEVTYTHRWDRITTDTTNERDVLFLSCFTQHHIYKVSLINGSIIATYGAKGNHVPGDLAGPRIGLSLPDTHQLIIGDYYNNRLQALNTVDGSFSILGAFGNSPRSVAVLEDRAYVAGKTDIFILEKKD